MKLVSLLVAFCFSFNVFASSGVVSELERELDSYHYALSVEWDQKDQAFYDAKTAEFFAALKALIKDNGLSQAQLMTVMEKKINDKNLLEAMKLKMSLLKTGSSAEDLAKMIKDSTKDMYAQGASWNGQAIVPVAVGILVAATIGYFIWWKVTHECVKYESQYICDTFYNCPYGAGHGYGGQNYGTFYNGSYCYGVTTTTSCGYTDVCTEYARK